MTFAFVFVSLVVLTFRRPATAVTAVLIMFPLEQLGQVSHSLFRRYGFLTNVLIGLLVVVAYGLTLISNRSRYRPAKTAWIRIFVVSLFVYAFISVFWSPASEIGMQRWTNGSLYLLVTVVFSPLLLNTTDDFAWVLRSFAVFGAILVIAFFFSDWTYRGVDIAGTNEALVLPLALAEFGGLLFLTVCLVGQSRNPLLVIARFLVAIGCIGLVFNTGSRGQLIVMIAVFLLFFPYIYRVSNFRRLVAGVVVLALLLSAVLYFYDAMEIGQARWQADALLRASEGRLHQAARLFTVWVDSSPAIWVFGLGNTASFHPDIIGFYPHVVLIEVLCEEGIIGATLFLAIIVLSVTTFFRSYRQFNGHHLQERLLLAYAAYGLFVVALSFKQGSLLTTPLLVFPVIMERFANSALYHIHREQRTAASGSPTTIPGVNASVHRTPGASI